MRSRKTDGQSQLKERSQYQAQSRLNYFFLIKMSLGVIFLALTAYGIKLSLAPTRFPFTTVEIIGDLHYQSKRELYDVMMPELNSGFFKLNVTRLHTKIIQLPWIHSATIRRVWPGKLVVTLDEHIPLAMWNSFGLINEKGDVFSPKTTTFPSDLPKFVAPDGKQMTVLQEFYKFGKILSPLALTITKIELAPRGAWYLSLTNGIDVILGTDEVEERMQRFVQSYNQVLSEQATHIAYVDLRYANGMAVGCKN